MDKESGIRKKAQRGTQERRYEEEDTNKKGNEKKKSEYLHILYWNVAGLKEGKEEEFWNYVR
jgi:hypothetical protein